MDEKESAKHLASCADAGVLTAEDTRAICVRGVTAKSPILIIQRTHLALEVRECLLSNVFIKDSHIIDANFAESEAHLICNNTELVRCFFMKTDLEGSAIGVGSVLEDCRFEFCNLRSFSLKDATLRRCSFNNSRLSGLELQGVMEACQVIGKISKSFFRGTFRECDFRAASFHDCGFYGAEFYECQFPPATLYFPHWQEALASIAREVRNVPLSADGRARLNTMLSVWHELGLVIKQNLVARHDFTSFEASDRDLLTELFRKHAAAA